MPHNPLLFSSPLLVMITDTMGRIIFIHENMKQFLGHPVSDYMGMDIESVVGEITKKNPFTTSRYPDLKMIFPFRGDNYCLSFQKVLLDEHLEVTMALLQRSGDMERQTVYHLHPFSTAVSAFYSTRRHLRSSAPMRPAIVYMVILQNSLPKRRTTAQSL